MTDDNNPRYRSTEPFSSRTAGPDGQGSDPLAELARLIGQTELFAERDREARAAADVRGPSYLDREPSHASLDPQPEYADRAPYDTRYDASYGAASTPSEEPDWRNPASNDPFTSPAYLAHDAPTAGDHRYKGLEDAHGFHSEFTTQQHEFDAASLDAALRRETDFPSSPLPLASDSDPLPLPPADELYDDVPQGGRRKGLLTVAAVLCLAVVGTAGAFGYRTYFGGASAKSPPPVIRASTEPTKVAPPPQQQADTSANKISYDRFGDRSQNEKVVLREEKPVDVKTAPNSAPAVSPPLATASTAPPGAANPPSVLTEPKRVRTVPIRPDTPEAAGRAQMPSQLPPQARQAVAAAPSNAPLNLANPVAPPPPAPAAAPPPAPAPSRAAAPAGNAPLSLSPDASPPQRSMPSRVASAPAGNGNGSYLVQVSSQRSEADAQAAFRNIRSKYSSVLGDRQPVIKRADLAGKGTYYRAMVGPFTTRDQAIQLCSSLKAAGGDCVVQSN